MVCLGAGLRRMNEGRGVHPSEGEKQASIKRAVQATDLLQSRKIIPDFATWAQCYSLYVTVIATHQPVTKARWHEIQMAIVGEWMLEECSGSHQAVPEQLSRIVTPLRGDVSKRELNKYPDRVLVELILRGISVLAMRQAALL